MVLFPAKDRESRRFRPTRRKGRRIGGKAGGSAERPADKAARELPLADAKTHSSRLKGGGGGVRRMLGREELSLCGFRASRVAISGLGH